MNDNLILTLPIKPQEKIKMGLCVAPLITELLRNTTSSKNAFAINLLNTYDEKDPFLRTYLNKLSDLDINYDKLFVDKENIDFLMTCIEEMISSKIIEEKESNVYRCDCRRVDTVCDSLRIYDNKALYYEKEGKFYCKVCNSELKVYKEKNLFMHLNPNVDTSINIFPTHFKNACVNFDKQFKGMDYLISKSRETGYKISHNGTLYNIDIDALWMNYFNYFENQSQVIVASNHQLFEMYLINYLNRMYKNKNLHFLATPYLVSKEKNIDSRFNEMRVLESKLNLLFSLKWKNLDSTYNTNAMDFTSKLSDDELLEINDIINTKVENENIDDAIKHVVLENINYQKVLKRRK